MGCNEHSGAFHFALDASGFGNLQAYGALEGLCGNLVTLPPRRQHGTKRSPMNNYGSPET